MSEDEKIIQDVLRAAVVWAQEDNGMLCLYCRKGWIKIKMGNESVGLSFTLQWDGGVCAGKEQGKPILIVIMGIFCDCSVT